MKEIKRLKLMKIVSVCYRVKEEALKHLGIKELEAMLEEWFAKANAAF